MMIIQESIQKNMKNLAINQEEISRKDQISREIGIVATKNEMMAVTKNEMMAATKNAMMVDIKNAMMADIKNAMIADIKNAMDLQSHLDLLANELELV